MTESNEDISRLLASVGADVNHLAVGVDKYFRCPQCSHTRTGNNKKAKCLSIKADDDGFVFKCHHCDWSGGSRNSKSNGHRRAAASAISKVPEADRQAAKARLKKALDDHNAAKTAAPERKQVTATYDYKAADGTLIYQKIRFEPKSFGQRRPDGKGGWTWGLGDATHVLYRLPELIKYPSATVFVCEGEKDADRVAGLGVCATSSDGGTWKPELVEPLRDRDVIIMADFDEAGERRAKEVGNALHGTAASIRMIFLPGLTGEEKNKDVSDWLDQDPARADSFADLCFKATLWTPDTPDSEVEGMEAAAKVGAKTPAAKADVGFELDDFYSYLPLHSYIFIPSREMWPAISVNAKVPPVGDISASRWLDINRAAAQMTWAPGLPLEIQDRIISDGGWIERKGVICLNLYRPPTITLGNSLGADRWVDHVRKVYPDDFYHIIAFCAHRVQRPHEKINHALFLGGSPGIGKDTLLAPVKSAVGPWNFQEVSPKTMLGSFNGFAKAVILRVSEARDLGDVNRYTFYDATKVYAAAPPDVLRVNEKHLKEHYVGNVCGVILTSNYKSDGLFLPQDDRRHYVAWSDLTAADFPAGYWNSLWGWYGSGGEQNVAAYLAELDISHFDPKAPPPKTPAFWSIVDANRAPEESELADILDKLGRPDATTLGRVLSQAEGSFEEWIRDRKNRRAIPHRFERSGYVPVRNDAATDGLWVIRKTRQVVYARVELSVRDRFRAAATIVRDR